MIKLRNLFHKKFESEHVARIESDEHVQKVDINEVVKKFRDSDIKCIGDVNILKTLEDVIKQKLMFPEVFSSMQSVTSYTGIGDSDSSVIQLEKRFYLNVNKIENLSNYFYKLCSSGNEELQKNLEKAAKNMEKLVSSNWRILNLFFELGIDGNDLGHNWGKLREAFTEKANEILKN